MFPPGGSSTLHKQYTCFHPVTVVHYTNSTQNDTKQIMYRTIQKFCKSAGRAPSLRVIPWHLPYNWGKSTEKPQSGKDCFRVFRALTSPLHPHLLLALPIHNLLEQAPLLRPGYDYFPISIAVYVRWNFTEWRTPILQNYSLHMQLTNKT